MEDSSAVIIIRRSGVVATLCVLAGVLLLMHGLTVYFMYGLGHPFAKGFVPLFNLGLESNVPTFFSSLILLIASQLNYWIARVASQSGSKYTNHWRILSLIFIYLALDEFAQIHELLTWPLKKAFNLDGALYFSWVLVGIVGVSLLALLYCRFIIDLPSRFRNELLLAGALYLSGVVGFEMVGGNYVSLYGSANLVYELIATGEELLEILGLIVLINALLKHLQTLQTSLLLSTQN